jgi:ATP-binding protein involved in chromosome partitioning
MFDMLLTKGKVLKALSHVEDPEIRQSLVELNMVRNIQIKRKVVELEVVLTIQGCPLKAKIEDDVKNALYDIGAKEVNLRFGAMTQKEREALSKKLTGSTPEPSGNPRPSLMKPNSSTQFIAVTSGKGGVGKSTVTVNLAVALAEQGYKVGLIDADIYGYSVPKMMGITQKPTMIEQLTLPVEKLGVKVMSIGFFQGGNEPIMWRGPMLGKTLRHFIEGVYWGELDYMLIDLPPGTGDVALDVHRMFPSSKDIIVTTPHVTASYIAERAGAMSLQNNRELLGVVENMAYYSCSSCDKKEYIFGQGGAQKVAEKLHTELLVQLPLGVAEEISSDPDIAHAVYKSETDQGKLFRELAQKVVTKASVPKPVAAAK